MQLAWQLQMQLAQELTVQLALQLSARALWAERQPNEAAE